MGRIGTEARAYLSDNDRFADAFNYLIYGGERVIKPEGLRPLDTSEASIPYAKESSRRTREPQQRYRDVLKLWQAKRGEDALYVVLGLEQQSQVHYAMPVRCMLYDSLNYAAQVKSAAAERQGRKAAEFLSGFSKEDRLMPVITLVLHLSATAWDGPTSIHQMIGDIDGKLLSLVPDYRINLLDPEDIPNEDFGRFSTGLGCVLKYLKYSTDSKKLGRMLLEDNRFRSIDKESADMINVLTGSNLQVEPDEDRVDMCKGIADMRRESWEKGREEGRMEMRKGIADMRRESWEKGREEGRMEMRKGIADMRRESWEKGRDEGREEAMVGVLLALVRGGATDVNAAMDMVNIPLEDRTHYAELVSQAAEA